MRLVVVLLLYGLGAELSVPGPSRIIDAFPGTTVVDSADSSFTKAERALLKAYRDALESIEIRRVSTSEVRRQLRAHTPVAIVDGYWVTPIDLVRLFRLPPVQRRIFAGLSSNSDANVYELLDNTNEARKLIAFAFTADALRGTTALPFVGDFRAGSAGRSGVFVVPVKDSLYAVSEYLPPPVDDDLTEPECYFFCGDPADWDFDSDGRPNRFDDDDDNDGVRDADDAYPYWAGGSGGPHGVSRFIGFTGKFSNEVAHLLMTAFERASSGIELKLGLVSDDADLMFVFPKTLGLPDRSCPSRSDRTVRFVSTDVLACAALRFRCEVGEEAFSNECGCGCIRPK